jgi:hypothetical protein
MHSGGELLHREGGRELSASSPPRTVSVGLSIKKVSLLLLYHICFIVGMTEGVLQFGIIAEILGLITIDYTFFVARNSTHTSESPYGGTLLTTHMAGSYSHDSHTVEGMLD